MLHKFKHILNKALKHKTKAEIGRMFELSISHDMQAWHASVVGIWSNICLELLCLIYETFFLWSQINYVIIKVSLSWQNDPGITGKQHLFKI